jgi:hypothetical protein
LRPAPEGGVLGGGAVAEDIERAACSVGGDQLRIACGATSLCRIPRRSSHVARAKAYARGRLEVDRSTNATTGGGLKDGSRGAPDGAMTRPARPRSARSKSVDLLGYPRATEVTAGSTPTGRWINLYAPLHRPASATSASVIDDHSSPSINQHPVTRAACRHRMSWSPTIHSSGADGS